MCGNNKSTFERMCIKGDCVFLVMLPTQRLMLHAGSFKGIFESQFFAFHVWHNSACDGATQLQGVTEDPFSEGATGHLCLRENYDYLFLIRHSSKAQGS